MFEAHEEIYRSTDKPAPRTAFVFALILMFLAGAICSLAIRSAVQHGRLSPEQLFITGFQGFLLVVLIARLFPIVYRALPSKKNSGDKA